MRVAWERGERQRGKRKRKNGGRDSTCLRTYTEQGEEKRREEPRNEVGEKDRKQEARKEARTE